MDKYEFNIKAEQIRKMADQGDYKTAMQIADTIDWRRVRNANLLASIADIYEENHEYEEAKDILLLAFERAPVGKRFLFRLSEISVKAGDIQEAQEFYREFSDLSPEDSRQYLLRYMILKAKGAPAEQLVSSLEQYASADMDEKWLYELAVLYSQAGRIEDCVKTCDKITLLFGLGKYVDKAMELKLKYCELSKEQLDLVENRVKYEEKLRAVSETYGSGRGNAGLNSPEREAVSARQREEAAEVPADMQTEPELQQEQKEEPQTSPDPGQKSETVTEEEAPESYHTAEEKVQLDVHGEKAEEREETSAEKNAAVPHYHMIIEARTQENGFKIAVDEIKYFHEKYGVNYKVAKTNADKLNERGFTVFVPKLTDKDLIIENAGRLRYSVVDEIEQYIENIQGTASVVLVDTTDHFDRMAEDRPGFIRRFDLVSDGEEDDLLEDVDLEDREADAPAEEPVKAPEIRPAKPYNAAVQAPQIPSEPVRPEAEVYPEVRPEVPLQENAKAVNDACLQEDSWEEQEEAAAEQRESVRPATPYGNSYREELRQPESTLPADYYQEMSVDDFATYAQEYAKNIDCVLPGKAVLALYERIELMEEDGIALTKASAEELIEEAADKAEKPGIGKQLTGMFHPKYDKDDKLILREENFID